MQKINLKIFDNPIAHITKMQNDTQYRKKIEKELYSGISNEILAKFDKAVAQNLQNKFALVSEIKKIDFSKNEKLNQIQSQAINLAQNYTSAFLSAYDENIATMGGRYICSDSFKEIFPSFRTPKDRALANDAVHNSSAVLGATQFEKVLKRNKNGKTKAIFITGIPGAGKTTFVKALNSDEIALIFEGQMANPVSVIPKIEQCLDKNLEVIIIVLHIEPESALENTFRRFNAYGRGGSLEVMSSIQGNLSEGLKKLKAHFGEKITLICVNRNENNQILTNENEIFSTINIGTKDEIFARLRVKLDADFASGKIDEACFNQADKTRLNSIMDKK